MYCPKCKGKLKYDEKYCKKCGKNDGTKALLVIYIIMMFGVYVGSKEQYDKLPIASALMLLATYSVIPILLSVRLYKISKFRRTFKPVGMAEGRLNHFSGLPFPQGVAINVRISSDSFIFIKDRQVITLSRDKITGADITRGKDAKKNAMFGAMAGSMLVGGVSGAALGMILSKNMYLAITYKGDDGVGYIVLEAGKGDLSLESIAYDLRHGIQGREQENICL